MIIKVIEEVEQNFKNFFLNNVNFVINEKVIKKGKLINIAIKDFFICFQLEIQKGGIKTFEIPYPYELSTKKKHILFDYRLDTLTHNDPIKFVKAKNFKPKKNSKFYDVQMIMKIV
jgi:hypothetical protein